MTKEELLNETDLFLLDLDGTLYLGDLPIGNAGGALAALRGMGKKILFLTNNSSRTEAEYRAKLSRLGLWEEGDRVYTSAMATVSLLKVRYPSARVFLVATDAVKEEFARAGILLCEDSPDVCVLAFDTTLTFQKMKAFNAFLKGGAAYIATHPDIVCPTEDVSMPDVGSFLALFECSSGRRPDLIVGKPYTVMGEEISRLTGIPRRKMCMAGDRMQTDIRFANNNGMKALLVLSGETTAANMSAFPDRPDLILPRFCDLV